MDLVKMIIPKLLTKKECLDIALGIEIGFKQQKICIQPRSDIQLFIKELRWLAENIDKSRASLSSEDQHRFVKAFLLVEQAKNISNVFRQLSDIVIPRDKMQFLNKRLNRLNQIGRSCAADILFELEVAGRLARLRAIGNMNVFFEEPDIVFEFTNGKIGLSCKRPKSVKRFHERIKSAANQGMKAGLPYIVVVGIRDAISNKPFFIFKNNDEFIKYIDTSIDTCLNNNSKSINYAFEKEAGGVIFCDRFVAIVEEPSTAFNWLVRHKYRANPKIENSDKVLKDFISIME